MLEPITSESDARTLHEAVDVLGRLADTAGGRPHALEPLAAYWTGKTVADLELAKAAVLDAVLSLAVHFEDRNAKAVHDGAEWERRFARIDPERELELWKRQAAVELGVDPDATPAIVEVPRPALGETVALWVNRIRVARSGVPGADRDA